MKAEQKIRDQIKLLEARVLKKKMYQPKGQAMIHALNWVLGELEPTSKEFQTPDAYAEKFDV